jgi:hypothetical protein
MRGADMGSGVEAATTMERHLEEHHPGVEWAVYLQELGTSTPREVRA